MDNKINWYERDIEDIYDYLSEIDDLKRFELIKYLIQNFSELEIDWIEVFEELRGSLLNVGKLTEVIDFANQLKLNFPEKYLCKYEFIERDIISHSLFTGNIEEVKRRLTVLEVNPANGIDSVTIRVHFQLIYAGYYQLALNYSKKVWKLLAESENLIGYPHEVFCSTIYLHRLEQLYEDIVQGKQPSAKSLLKEMGDNGFDETLEVFECILKNLRDSLDIDLINQKIEIESKDLLLSLNIQFIKEMKEEFGLPFMLTDRFFNLLQEIELFGHTGEINNFFYIPYPILANHVIRIYDNFLLSNDVELFGKVFGLKYVYKFLHKHLLIDTAHYQQMLQNLRMLENEFELTAREDLWQMKFIFEWPKLFDLDPYDKKIFTDTYFYFADDSVSERLVRYFQLFQISENTQKEIDIFNALEGANAKSKQRKNHKFSAWTSTEPIVNLEPKISRNDPCPCGSGKKYKKCCFGKNLNNNNN